MWVKSAALKSDKSILQGQYSVSSLISFHLSSNLFIRGHEDIFFFLRISWKPFFNFFSFFPQTSMSAWRTTEAATTSAVTQWDLLNAAAKRATNFSLMNGRVKVSEWPAAFSATSSHVKTNFQIVFFLMTDISYYFLTQVILGFELCTG